MTTPSKAFEAHQTAVREASSKLHRQMRDVLETYIQLGKALEQAKKDLPHGEYGKLVEAEGLSRTTAHRARNFYKKRDLLKPGRLKGLTVAKAEELLSSRDRKGEYYELPNPGGEPLQVTITTPASKVTQVSTPAFTVTPKKAATGSGITMASVPRAVPVSGHPHSYTPPKPAHKAPTVSPPQAQKVESRPVPLSNMAHVSLPTKTYAKALRKNLSDEYQGCAFIDELISQLEKLERGDFLASPRA